MTARIRVRDTGGTLRTVARIRVRDESGTLRTVQRVRIRDASNTLRTAFQYFTIAVSPPSISEIGSTVTVVTATPAVVTATGGAAPVTYSWVNLYGDAITASTPFAASTTFRKTGVAHGDSYEAAFACFVTDALGTTLESDPVTVSISRS